MSHVAFSRRRLVGTYSNPNNYCGPTSQENVGSLRDFERFVLAEAKWTALPSARDTMNLRLVAAKLPKGSVRRQTVICRCANAYPLGSGIEAMPLAEVGRLID